LRLERPDGSNAPRLERRAGAGNLDL